jgi:hypothetical protein
MRLVKRLIDTILGASDRVAPARTGNREISGPAFSLAMRMSWAPCKLSQNGGSVPNQCPKRRAVSPVTAPLPAMIFG